MKTMPKALRSALQLLVICIVALTPMPAYAGHSGDYIPNTAGRLRIGVAREEKPIILVDEPAIIKTTLDQGWHRVRNEWNKRVVTFLNDLSDETIEVTSDLATIDNAELQMMKLDNGVSLKYVLHHNKTRLVLKDVWYLGELSYVINFDIELVLAVQTTHLTDYLQVTDVAIRLQHIKIDGDGWISDLMLPLVEALLQNVQEYVEGAGSTLLASMQEIGDQFLVAILKPIPTEAIYVEIDVDSQDGAITLCFKSAAAAICNFPVAQEHAKNR